MISKASNDFSFLCAKSPLPQADAGEHLLPGPPLPDRWQRPSTWWGRRDSVPSVLLASPIFGLCLSCSHPPRTPSFPPSTSFSHCHSFFYFINRFLICHYIYTHLPALQNTLRMESKIITSDSLSHSRSKSSVVILQAFLFSSCLFKFIFHWRVIALCCAGVYHTTTWTSVHKPPPSGTSPLPTPQGLTDRRLSALCSSATSH